MNTKRDLLVLFALAWTGWFVWDSLRLREIANAAMRETCAGRDADDGSCKDVDVARTKGAQQIR